MELKILFKNTSYLLITRIVKFAVGFIRAKLIAIFLGTYGTGIIAQLTQMTEAMARFTVSGMNDGLVKEIAESDKEEETLNKNLLSYKVIYYNYINSINICYYYSLFFSKQFTIYFFGDIKYFSYFLIGLVSFPIFDINGISFAILKSFKQIKYIARSELIVINYQYSYLCTVNIFWAVNWGSYLHYICLFNNTYS